MEGSSNCGTGCDGKSVAMIPKIQKTLNIDLPSSSMVSAKEGCESPLSSWDSEPEADSMDYGFSWEIDNRSYDELLKKLIEKEEELRVSNLKLQLSEQENIKLVVQVENSEILVDDACEKLKLKEHELNEQKKLLGDEIAKLKIQNLKSENQLDDVRGELELKEKELNEKKEISEQEVFKLKNQIKECENQLDNVQGELNLKNEELQKQTAKLETHIEEEKKNVAILKGEIETLVRTNEDNVNNHHKELRKMISVLFDLQVKKRDLDSDIASLSNLKKQLISKLEDCESRNKKLEEKVKQYEAENLQQKKLHSIQLKDLEDEIDFLNMKRVEGSFNYVCHSKKRNSKKR
ncbi:unnamed protein product [Vicia faba]|uniref:Uncharacterized protein n=1 Tax=Vicia faba TaxID=3906 RepID=A0AAV0ZLB6_VICFA|nr:unnamed protein product [Vicia faba]